jgi:hypothetical protein
MKNDSSSLSPKRWFEPGRNPSPLCDRGKGSTAASNTQSPPARSAAPHGRTGVLPFGCQGERRPPWPPSSPAILRRQNTGAGPRPPLTNRPATSSPTATASTSSSRSSATPRPSHSPLGPRRLRPPQVFRVQRRPQPQGFPSRQVRAVPPRPPAPSPGACATRLRQ